MSNQSPLPTNFTDFLHKHLNQQQRQAVTHASGSLLVIACAGSGKTRVITARIAYLMLEHNAPASSILALTFTNKAAHEMRHRVASYLPADSALPFVGTFHAYCLRILKQYIHLVDRPFASILDTDDARMIIDGIIKRNGLQKTISAKSIQHQISLYKNQLNATSSTEWSRNDPLLMQIYAAYEQEKTSNKSLDFDDLLLMTLRLFKNHAAFRHDFHARIRHILVDEYQDTNSVQHALLKCMAQDNNTLVIDSLCAVGDEDQSIYSWRGATVSNILHFNQDFPDTTVIKVEQNYRSHQHILDSANALITNNTHRTPKRLWSEHKGIDRVRHILCSSEYQEADAVALFFATVMRAFPTASCALLYRAHFQSRALEEAFIKNSLAYTIIGGIQFYERKEIKDLLAYLRLACNPFDRISFLRTINCPTRGLGDKFIEFFLEQWNASPHDSWTIIAKQIMPTLSGVRAGALAQFTAIFEDITAESDPLSALEHVIQATRYHAYIRGNNEESEARERWENIQELLRAVTHIKELGIKTIAAFLDEVALMQEKQDAHKDDTHPISLMTLHAAKGLEFDYVVVAGLEEGILPSTRSLSDATSLEEERRLLYVGITRARNYLLLSHCTNRYTYGTITPQSASRFLGEIPQHLLISSKLTHMSQAEVRAHFSSWLRGTAPAMPSTVITFGNTPTPQRTVKPPSQSPRPSLAPIKNTSAWKCNQLVQHAQFGVGMIIALHERGTGEPLVTVKFKANTKKISAQFLQRV